MGQMVEQASGFVLHPDRVRRERQEAGADERRDAHQRVYGATAGAVAVYGSGAQRSCRTLDRPVDFAVGSSVGTPNTSQCKSFEYRTS